jgi:hypothetical protein
MKKSFLAIGVLIAASAFTYNLKHITPGHKYTMTLTVEDWQSKIQYLETAKQIMAKSTLPANVVSQWSDSLSKFEQEISAQIGSQVAADTVKKK